MTPTPQPAQLYLSLANDQTFGGLSVANEDIVSWNGSSAVMVFDGGDVGLSALALDAFDIISPNEILLSFTTAAVVPGLGQVDGADIVEFTATSLGDTTAGTFSMYVDGSDVGLTGSSGNIDAVHQLPDGHLLLSTVGNSNVGGVSGGGEDIFEFVPSSLGADTAGTAAKYFTGKNVGLSSHGGLIDGVAVNAAGQLYLSTSSSFSVSGLSGADEDVFVFTPTSLGATTAGTFASPLFFDGSLYSLSANNVTDFDLP